MFYYYIVDTGHIIVCAGYPKERRNRTMVNKIGTAVRPCIFLLLCLALLATGALGAGYLQVRQGVLLTNPIHYETSTSASSICTRRNSPDAFAAGSRQTWDEAFRYGRGEEVTLHTTRYQQQDQAQYPL